jgi:hypothetical protein
MDHGEWPCGNSNHHRVHARWMPVFTDDDSDEQHGEAPEEPHNWIAEAHIEFSFIFLSPCFSGMAGVARSDASWGVSSSIGDLLCRPDRIAVERGLCRPIPVARAKTYFELSRAGCRDRMPGVMAVHQAPRFREELQEILIWVHSSPFLVAAVLSTAAGLKSMRGGEDQGCTSLSTKVMAASCHVTQLQPIHQTL